MNDATPLKLPANPYRRSPIRDIANLAGRSQERKLLRYYFRLTASGDNPHLALIGDRGIGKTSLLNAAQSIAEELSLLVVRLDLNQQKVQSIGRFWHDFYQSLILAAAKVDCWGGPQGVIYGEMLRMMYAGAAHNIDKAVLQMPFVFSCHKGTIDDFECPDALIVSDLAVCIDELKRKNRLGIAFLIDEADCIGANVALLQMIRNVFQAVSGCSLVLAGTGSFFPIISDVFSPIPRQFHRIDVKPFGAWSETLELVLRPLFSSDEVSSIAPTMQSVRDLHELCGGAPDETQLYCHHMFRVVETTAAKKMSLSPDVLT
jgi:hypothetical protein